MTQQVFNNIIHDLWIVTRRVQAQLVHPMLITYLWFTCMYDSVVLSGGGDTCFNLLHSRLQVKQNYGLGHCILSAISYVFTYTLYVCIPFINSVVRSDWKTSDNKNSLMHDK